MPHTLPELPYTYNALEPYIDEQTMLIHHTKHHQAYVDKLNAALKSHGKFAEKELVDLLEDLGGVPAEIRMAVRNNGGGHANHNLFWTLLTPAGPTEPAGEFAEALTETFGSLPDFKKQFTDAATNRFGSGWAWLVLQEKTLVIGSTANQDTPLMGEDIAGLWGTPLLALDVWEHAYYIKYFWNRAEYVNNWWNVVNWEAVGKRYTAAI